jgi:tetratricopeptide (TPR) repeat protein
MSDEKSIPAGELDGTAQAYGHSKSVVRRQRNNMKMVQNVHLIWLDNRINDNSADCCNTITQLKSVINTINTYTDGEECIEFFKSMTDEKACMIISGSLGQHFVPRVHNMSQVDSIFIFCVMKQRHEEWVKEWPKIKGVFTKITPICEELKKAAQQCEQNAISISFMATSSDASNKNLDHLEPSFMYTQILKEILFTIEFKQKYFKDYIDYCRDVFAENQGELTNVDELEEKYRHETPIWWYTYQCFLYPMLNRCLRLMDADIIIKMGFFIRDLHYNIRQLHKEQFGGEISGKSFTVYRGQGMSKAEFEQMIKAKGGLISFNNFLSTSKNRKVSLDFANLAVTNPDLMGILFVMTIDPAKSITPFASIADVSYFQGEDEVLFSMNTVFRINEIKPMSENDHLFQVELTLTDDNDKDLRRLTDRIREETFPNLEGLHRLGLVLIKMGQSDKAEEVYEVLLEQTTKESEKAHIYNQLGRVKGDQEKYHEAVTFYKKSIEIRHQSLPPNHPDLAMSYNNIGLLYHDMDKYSKALLFHEKALVIRQESLPPDHPDLAKSYNNIGNVYFMVGVYSKALSSYEKALEIKQQSLPPNHPSLASTYDNIGNVYKEMGEYSKAFSFYERAVDIGKQSLPSNNPKLQSYRRNLEDVQKKL